jgi:glycosyltransferase involved in cell wall biosynthesis
MLQFLNVLLKPTAERPGAPPREQAARKTHVCLVAPAAWPVLAGARDVKFVGGVAVQQSILARAFSARGHRVSMVTMDHGQPEGIEIQGVVCHKAHRPEAGVPVIRFLHPRLTSLWRALRRADADIYYVRGSSMLTAVVHAFCRRYGRKWLYAAASDTDFLPGEQRIRYARDRWLFEYGLRRADAIVVQNPVQQANCLAHYGRRATIIPSCYAPPPGASADRSGGVLWVSDLREVKQPQLCIDLAKRLPHRRFVMIGGPASPDEADMQRYRSIERQARELPNVRFLGFLPLADAESHFDRARVLLNTSRTEGFPNTFLQAWARGVPTPAFVDVGSREGAAPVGRVARDLPEAQAELEQLLSDDVHWKQASDRCRRQFAAHHSVAGTTARYSALFRDLLLGHEARP